MTTPGSSLEMNDSGDNNVQNPFEVDFLGSTVIHLDEALQRVREIERIKQEKLEQSGDSAGLKKQVEKESTCENVAQLDAQKLDGKIKKIVNQVCFFLRVFEISYYKKFGLVYQWHYLPLNTKLCTYDYLSRLFVISWKLMFYSYLQLIPIIKSKNEVCSEEKVEEITSMVSTLVANEHLPSKTSNLLFCSLTLMLI